VLSKIADRFRVVRKMGHAPEVQNVAVKAAMGTASIVRRVCLCMRLSEAEGASVLTRRRSEGSNRRPAEVLRRDRDPRKERAGY
jgi:hypothetical protein